MSRQREPGQAIFEEGESLSRNLVVELNCDQRRELQQLIDRELSVRSVVASPAYVGLAVAVHLGTRFASDSPATMAWTVSLLLLFGLVRLFLALRFFDLYERSPAQWRRAFAITTLCLAGVWTGFVCVGITRYGLSLTSFLLLLCSAGICVGATGSLALDRLLFRSWLGVMCLPLVVTTPFTGGQAGLVMSAVFSLYFVVLWKEGNYAFVLYSNLAKTTLLLRMRARELEDQIEGRRVIGAALRESESRHRTLIDHAPICIFEVDLDGALMSMNPAGLQMLGDRDERDVIGLPFLDLVSPTDRNRVGQLVRSSLEGGVSTEFEFAVDLDGESRTFASSLIPLRGDDGCVCKLMGVSLDISARAETEREMLRAREEAIEASRLKSQFLANMSHEMRTPMNAIIGLTGLLLEEDRDVSATQKDYLELIRSSATSLITIINDVLDLSSMESGGLKLRQVPFDLGELMVATLEPLAIVAERRGLELRYEIAPELSGAVVGDPDRLRQIMTNLVENSIKFTDAGQVVIRVGARPVCGSRLDVQFSVEDSGIGIPQEMHDRIFSYFEQGDGTATRCHGGTGLGLPISRNLVRAMGGELDYESSPGEGTRFFWGIELPLADPGSGGREPERVEIIVDRLEVTG